MPTNLRIDMEVALIVAKIGGALVTVIVSAYAKFHPTPWLSWRRRKSRATKDYEFIASFLETPLEWRSRIEVEQFFYAWRRRPMRYTEIVAMLRFANPSIAFHWRESVARFVILNDEGKFSFREDLGNSASRRRRVKTWTAMYFVFAMIAATPLWMATTLYSTPLSAWWALAVPFLFVFSAAALLALDYAASLSLGEKFLAEQGRRTRVATLPSA